VKAVKFKQFIFDRHKDSALTDDHHHCVQHGQNWKLPLEMANCCNQLFGEGWKNRFCPVAVAGREILVSCLLATCRRLSPLVSIKMLDPSEGRQSIKPIEHDKQAVCSMVY